VTRDDSSAVDSRAAILKSLRRLGLVGADEAPAMAPLTGGVSSDIWRVELAGGMACVKRALPRLKVAALWEAPVTRNHTEAEWMRVAAAIVPGSAPRLLAEDGEAGLFAMAFLEPGRFPLWKAELRDGKAEPAFAAQVGDVIGAIHAGTAGRADIAQRFATDAIFHAIRLEPYLLATARAHPDLASVLEALAERTSVNKRTLVHGDVSPKNILIGPDGPVFLDAECAWYGDPAFDLAFCLNHMLLKCLWTPEAAELFLACFAALAEAYLARVDWEAPEALEARAASLLPGLFLARVDGKSPVEYVTDEAQKDQVRRVASALLQRPPVRLATVAEAWREEIGA
jgi:aminoglycoside phosphotransferase (APT) family kinase protein